MYGFVQTAISPLKKITNPAPAPARFDYVNPALARFLNVKSSTVLVELSSYYTQTTFA